MSFIASQEAGTVAAMLADELQLRYSESALSPSSQVFV